MKNFLILFAFVACFSAATQTAAQDSLHQTVSTKFGNVTVTQTAEDGITFIPMRSQVTKKTVILMGMATTPSQIQGTELSNSSNMKWKVDRHNRLTSVRVEYYLSTRGDAVKDEEEGDIFFAMRSISKTVTFTYKVKKGWFKKWVLEHETIEDTL